MHCISFSDFDDLQLAYEHKRDVDLAMFRAMISREETPEDTETARVVLHATDGNDYVIIGTGVSFWFIALTNGMTGRGDFIAFDEYETLAEALHEMTQIILVDNEHV